MNLGNNIKIVTMLVVVLISGCKVGVGQKPKWKSAPLEYNCSIDDMTKVEREAKFCIENTAFFDTYCYGSAIIRNCEKINNGG